MLGRLPVIDITAYNGYSFPAAETVETLAYKLTANYDSARRTVSTSTIDVTIRWYIAAPANGTTSTECADMVARLQRPAGVLQYNGRGFGVGVTVNQGRVWDADWGPRPSTVELEPVGNGQTIRCTWSVQFTIATCPDAIYQNAIREYCFAYDFAIDRAGRTTRTYKGHVSIAVTRASVSSRAVPDSADRFLETITPAPLLGFRRESQTRSLSEDKSTLTLTVVDVEWPALAPPTGSVDANLEHTFTTEHGNWAKWVGTLTGTYEIARSNNIGSDTQKAIQDFLTAADARLASASTMIIGVGLPGPPPENAGKPVTRNGIIPVGFSVSEPDAFGPRKVRISMSYFIAGVGLSEILAKSGLWTPVGTQYNFWQQATPTPFLPRGIANLVFNPGTDDNIVDLCGSAAPVTSPNGNTALGGPLRQPTLIGNQSFSLANEILKVFPAPTPASSWIAYRAGVAIAAATGRVVGIALPTEPIDDNAQGSSQGNSQGGWDVLQGPTSSLPANSPFPPLTNQLGGPDSDGSIFVQQRTTPKLQITLTGSAVRVGYPIPVPQVVTVNGATPILVGNPQFVQEIVGMALVPVYGARWSLTYVFAGDDYPVGPIPNPPNPYLA